VRCQLVHYEKAQPASPGPKRSKKRQAPFSGAILQSDSRSDRAAWADRALRGLVGAMASDHLPELVVREHPQGFLRKDELFGRRLLLHVNLLVESSSRNQSAADPGERDSGAAEKLRAGIRDVLFPQGSFPPALPFVESG